MRLLRVAVIIFVANFGSEWYPRNMYIDKDNWQGRVFRHHRETWGDQSKFGYKDFIPMFKAEKFDPEAWARLFKETGAKYVAPVAEHHDGFPLYACGFTEWDASEMGPRRDLISALEKAVRAEGLKFGVSSHRAFNWLYYVRDNKFDNADPKYAGLYGRPLPFLFKQDAANYKENWPPQDEEFKDDWLARTTELVDKFNPDLVWFDFGIANDRERTPQENPFAGHLKRFAAYYYNHAVQRGETGVINYKWSAFPEKAAVLDLERSKMDNIRTPFWQTDTAVSKSSWGYTENQQYIRFTTKGDVLYAIILNWPASGKSTIKSLAADSPHYPREIQSVSMLGSSDNIAFDRRDDGLVVTLPKAKPCEHAFVLKIE